MLTVQADTYAMDAHRLYVVDRDDSRSTYGLTAYRLADGQRQWHVPISSSPMLSTSKLEVDDAGLFVHQTALDGGLPRVRELDPATGKQRWSRSGLVAGRTAELQLLRLAPPERFSTAALAFPTETMIALDRASGMIRWQHRFDPSVHVFGATSNLGTLVASTPDGALTAYDLHTGGQLASRPVPTTGPATALAVVGSLVLRHEPQVDGPPVLTAFRADTLDLVWTTTHAPADAAHLTPCGPLICIAARQGPLHALDPATGEVVWTFGEQNWQFWPAWQQSTAGEHAEPLMYLQARSNSGEVTQVLLGTSTGTPMLETSDWWLEPTLDPRGPVWAVTQDGHDHHMLVGRLASDGTNVLPVGSVERAAHCIARERHLACGTGPALGPGDVQVWRLR